MTLNPRRRSVIVLRFIATPQASSRFYVVAERRSAPIYKEYWLAVELQSVEICLLVPIVFVSACSIQKPLDPQYCWPPRGNSLTGWYSLGSIELKP